MDKNDIIDILEEIAVLLELKGEGVFKVRAYQSGARVLETLEEDFKSLVDNNGLINISGIGKALVEKITTLYNTGKLDYYDQLKASVPNGLIEMLDIPGLGAKKIKAIHEKLGVDSIDKLTEVCQKKLVADLPGFGVKSQNKILTGIKNREAYGKRHLWWRANKVAEIILNELNQLPEVELIENAGSLRRCLETVGDLDFIVASSKPEPVMKKFTSLDNVVEITAKGETKSSVRFDGGMQADLRVVPKEQFYFALHHFTGSKDHNILMRQRALSKGYSLSEWGITAKGADSKLPMDKQFNSEKEIFEFLDLNYIPPELREGIDELDASEKNVIPVLINQKEIRGSFHNHTNVSDGKNTLDEMAEAAQSLRWDFLGIADHSKSSFQANGLSEERLFQQIEKIRKINQSGKYKTHLFSGVECDILPNGELDFADDILKELDYVVVSVHSAFSQSEDEMTSRVIRALENPYATMLGHPTGRLLLRREAYAINLEKIIDTAISNNKIIELNANPLRLDLDWRLWKKAAEKGLLCAINPDAHNTKDLNYVIAGVNVARKGWLESSQIINTFSLDNIKRLFLKN